MIREIKDSPNIEELDLLRSRAEIILGRSADYPEAHSFGGVLCFLARVRRFVFNL
jgi:hypothetical protein